MAEMDGTTVPQSPPKNDTVSHPPEIEQKTDAVRKSSDEMENQGNSQEAVEVKLEPVDDKVNVSLEQKVSSNSQTNVRTIPASEERANKDVDAEREVTIGQVDQRRKSVIDSHIDRTAEEGVTKAVTELTLQQTDKITDRPNQEVNSCETKLASETNERTEPVIVTCSVERTNEAFQMDVDPPIVDAPPSAIVGRWEDAEEDGTKRQQSPNIKKEDETIDEAWKSDDFNLPPSDDEEGFSSEQPPPYVIVELYQKLDQGSILELEWTCLGRRTPEEDGEEMEVEDAVQDNQEVKLDQPVEEDPTEFDFDIDAVIQNEVTPRRIPGFEPKGSGSAKKRVAKMDKVINDIRRFSKINKEMEKTGDAAPPHPSDLEVTAQRPLGKFHIRRDLHQ